jgi:hypothetical protein
VSLNGGPRTTTHNITAIRARADVAPQALLRTTYREKGLANGDKGKWKRAPRGEGRLAVRPARPEWWPPDPRRASAWGCWGRWGDVEDVRCNGFSRTLSYNLIPCHHFIILKECMLILTSLLTSFSIVISCMCLLLPFVMLINLPAFNEYCNK